MKKILIAGENSYIGTSFEKYMRQWPQKYQVDTVSVMGDQWESMDFSGYDVVYQVAGIAHIKETPENAPLYYQVNRDLAINVAKKAKAEGVGQFIYLSSMSVYGMEEGCIVRSTGTAPKGSYGKSKLQAEEGLHLLESEAFKVAIMRPPMVYGDGCKGNYQSLIKIAKKLPFFPNYKNQRSMIHIDRLSWFVKELVDRNCGGLYLPQDEQYVCTCQMVQGIAQDMGKKMPLLSVLNPFVWLAKHCTNAGKKAFGDLYYDLTEDYWGNT